MNQKADELYDIAYPMPKKTNIAYPIEIHIKMKDFPFNPAFMLFFLISQMIDFGVVPDGIGMVTMISDKVCVQD